MIKNSKFINEVILGSALYDSRLTRIAERLNIAWRKVRYVLMSNGYLETNQNTFILARELMKSGFNQALKDVGCEWQDIDKYHLNQLVEGSRNDSIMYTLLQYPSLGNFSAVYYKVRNRRLQTLISKQDFEANVCYEENTIETLHMLRERFDILRLMSMSDEVIDELEGEIQVLDSLIVFISLCEEMTYEADHIFDTYLDEIKNKLSRIESDVTEIEYQEFKLLECKKVQSLAGRFEDAVFYITDVSEN